MIDSEVKLKKEEEILTIFFKLYAITDENSLEYKKLLQKISVPIWDWTLMCFLEDDVRKAGLEIFHCIKRTIKNYKEQNDSSYIAYLYFCLDNEIRHKKEKSELKEFRMCTKNEYSRAVELVKESERIGKNPYNENVQNWLSKQSGLSLKDVKDLIFKYHQSQIIEEQIKENEEGDKTSIFETDFVHNNYLNPEETVLKTEYVLEDLKIIEHVFNECQERQKVYLSSFITLKLLQVLEKSFLILQIVELLQNRTFLDSALLKNFIYNQDMPSQSALAAKYKKDEGYISNRISEFFEKVKREISS